jgi:hypothetical protein
VGLMMVLPLKHADAINDRANTEAHDYSPQTFFLQPPHKVLWYVAYLITAA